MTCLFFLSVIFFIGSSRIDRFFECVRTVSYDVMVIASSFRFDKEDFQLIDLILCLLDV